MAALRRALRLLAATSLGTLSLAAYTAYEHRPRVPPPERVQSDGLHSPAEDPPSLLLARCVALGTVTALSRLYLSVLNDFKVVGNEDNYRRLLAEVDKGAEGRDGRALLTVANHTSVLDDVRSGESGGST
jgi:hypothetical protein